MEAIIGYTGFVGGIIASQHVFSHQYNSKNIQESSGKEFDLLVCAAAPGKKWLANQNPEADLATIENITASLDKITAKRFVLMSTVDVYDLLSGANEDHAIDINSLQPYGKHRLMLEQFVQSRYPQSHIIRLPALFGPGLKKNFIFDLINHRMLDYTHPDSYFQFYNMRRVWQDIQTIIREDIRLITMATEPVRAGDIAQRALGIQMTPGQTAKPIRYGLTTKYARLFGGRDGYLFDKNQILQELCEFIKSEPRSET